MNNKRLGNQWEKEFCNLLASKGYWVHFIASNRAGQQPFDVIAVKDNIPFAFDCKTAVKPIFPLSRLEENQKFAFEKWIDCGNENCFLAIKYDGRMYLLKYADLKGKGKIDLREVDYVATIEGFD